MAGAARRDGAAGLPKCERVHRAVARMPLRGLAGLREAEGTPPFGGGGLQGGCYRQKGPYGKAVYVSRWARGLKVGHRDSRSRRQLL